MVTRNKFNLVCVQNCIYLLSMINGIAKDTPHISLKWFQIIINNNINIIQFRFLIDKIKVVLLLKFIIFGVYKW